MFETHSKVQYVTNMGGESRRSATCWFLDRDDAQRCPALSRHPRDDLLPRSQTAFFNRPYFNL